jgi:hypothetical protein
VASRPATSRAWAISGQHVASLPASFLVGPNALCVDDYGARLGADPVSDARDGRVKAVARMTALGALRSAHPTGLRSPRIVGSSSLTVG